MDPVTYKSRCLNPCDYYFWKNRGYKRRPDNWREILKHEGRWPGGSGLLIAKNCSVNIKKTIIHCHGACKNSGIRKLKGCWPGELLFVNCSINIDEVIHCDGGCKTSGGTKAVRNKNRGGASTAKTAKNNRLAASTGPVNPTNTESVPGTSAGGTVAVLTPNSNQAEAIVPNMNQGGAIVAISSQTATVSATSGAIAQTDVQTVSGNGTGGGAACIVPNINPEGTNVAISSQTAVVSAATGAITQTNFQTIPDIRTGGVSTAITPYLNEGGAIMTMASQIATASTSSDAIKRKNTNNDIKGVTSKVARRAEKE